MNRTDATGMVRSAVVSLPASQTKTLAELVGPALSVGRGRPVEEQLHSRP